MTEGETEFQALTRRLYEVVSAHGGTRDWESVRDLYHPRATLVRTGIDENGESFVKAMSFDEYVQNATEMLKAVRFEEVEVHQDVTEFGNVARLASVYEYTFSSDTERRCGRGVNFFNLINEGQGWKVMSIVWDNERPGLSLIDAGILTNVAKCSARQ